MTKILIVTALQAEARPLIEFYQLEKRQFNEKLYYFQKDEITCLTTGVGTNNVRKRIPIFLDNIDCKNTFLINIGIAGGNSKITKIGNLYITNKITDEENGKIWFPDNLIRHELEELPLITVSKGVTDGEIRYDGLVDMEASAIFETAVKRIPAKRMIILKIVSDHMDKVLDRPEQVIHLVENQLSEIHRIIALFHGMLESNGLE